MRPLEPWEEKILGEPMAWAHPDGCDVVKPEMKAMFGEAGKQWSIPLFDGQRTIGALVILQKVKNAKTIEAVKKIFDELNARAE